MLKDCVIVALVAVIVCLGSFQVYGQRVAELDRVETLWKEAIKRCLAD